MSDSLAGHQTVRTFVNEKLAVVVTRADTDEPTAALIASSLGYRPVVPRAPSIHTIARHVPDLVLVDWAPGDVPANTELVREMRSNAVLR